MKPWTTTTTKHESSSHLSLVVSGHADSFSYLCPTTLCVYMQNLELYRSLPFCSRSYTSTDDIQKTWLVTFWIRLFWTWYKDSDILLLSSSLVRVAQEQQYRAGSWQRWDTDSVTVVTFLDKFYFNLTFPARRLMRSLTRDRWKALFSQPP